MTREVVAQQPPSRPLDGFPVREITPETELLRAHSAAFGAWWFSSDGGGRFDLPHPRGTCYLADSALVAVRERLGVVLGGAALVPSSLLAGVVVSRLQLPTPRLCADVQARAATRFGVTRELETMVPYAVPQAWARGFADVGLEGVSYGPRFTTGPGSSVAVFGAAGSADLPVDAQPVAAQAVPGVPVAVDPPRLKDLDVVRPPRTRGTSEPER